MLYIQNCGHVDTRKDLLETRHAINISLLKFISTYARTWLAKCTYVHVLVRDLANEMSWHNTYVICMFLDFDKNYPRDR